MVNPSYTARKAVLDAIAAKLTAASLTPKFIGENFTLAPDSPIILIDAKRTSKKPLDMDSTFEVTEQVGLIVLVRESTPATWQDDTLKIVCKVEDAIHADPTLNGAAKFAYPTYSSTGQVIYCNKTFFGGEVGVEAIYYFAP